MSDKKLKKQILKLIKEYHKSFSEKRFKEIKSKDDILMNVFEITEEIKNQNKQYWGRELGFLWELIVIEVFKNDINYKCKPVWDGQSPCDFFIKDYAIDPKYRIGSGDSGTLKGWARDGDMLKEKGYKPIMLILREDNLPAAIRRISPHWELKIGEEALDFIKEESGFDLKEFLISLKGKYDIKEDILY